MSNGSVKTTKYFAYLRRLPLGCVYCMKGVKAVIFITGMCSEKCFYCPVSQTKLYKDVVWVDEERVHSFEEIIVELHRVGADGVGITGGDPLYYTSRTAKLIAMLKHSYGPSFHIHLYTSGRYATPTVLRVLEDSGLDELRFHPVEEWMLERILLARRLLTKTGVGVEVPVIPDREEELKRLISWLDEKGVEFINLNELEASPSNIARLASRGYDVDPSSMVVRGSEETALRVLDWAARNTKRISVHYCPARYKNMVQLKLRLIRKALRTKSCSERVTSNGLLKTSIARLNGGSECEIPIGKGYATTSDQRQGGCSVEVQPVASRERTYLRLALALCGSTQH